MPDYRKLSDYLKETYGQKLYKIALDGGMTCPNRDGTKGTRGCIFCSAGGSGDFAEKNRGSIDEQIERAKKRIESKYKGSKFIAYFQAFTNTYAPVEQLRQMFLPVVMRDDIAVLSVATRPDCLPSEVLELLAEVNTIKPVWVELGLQTVHQKSVDYIRRAYENAEYERAVTELKRRGIYIVTHVILGLPGETKEQMTESVKYACEHSHGIKLQLLHVLKGTDLARDYEEGKFKALELDEYLDILSDALKVVPPNVTVHRLTGDGPKKDLIAPLWSANKKMVLNQINKL